MYKKVNVYGVRNGTDELHDNGMAKDSSYVLHVPCHHWFFCLRRMEEEEGITTKLFCDKEMNIFGVVSYGYQNIDTVFIQRV